MEKKDLSKKINSVKAKLTESKKWKTKDTFSLLFPILIAIILIMAGIIIPKQLSNIEFASAIPWTGYGLAIFVFISGTKKTFVNYFGRQKAYKTSLKVLGEMLNPEAEIAKWESKKNKWELHDIISLIFLLAAGIFIAIFGFNYAGEINKSLPPEFVRIGLYIAAIATPIRGIVKIRKEKNELCNGKISNLKGLSTNKVPN